MITLRTEKDETPLRGPHHERLRNCLPATGLMAVALALLLSAGNFLGAQVQSGELRVMGSND